MKVNFLKTQIEPPSIPVKRTSTKPSNLLIYRAAQLISIVGHPLVSGSVISFLVFFQLFEVRRAFFLSGFILFLISIPAAAWNYYKTKSGAYANFNVSVRSQRTSMYIFLIGLMAMAILLARLSQQPKFLLVGLSLCFALVLISFVVNYFLKTSLHTAMSFFLAFGLWQLHTSRGIVMFFMALLVSSSRLILKRHTFPEVISGSCIGSGTGALLFYFLPVG
jgi:membrane-associated phospholipid phosphatase